jgi:hypothetical protein
VYHHPSTNTTIEAELTGDDRATAAGVTAHSSSPILALCRALLAAGFDPDAPLVACRDGTVAVRVRTIGECAGLEINGKGTNFTRPAVGTASPVRKNGSRVSR